jgi:CHAT domain-containing protein
VLHSSHHAQSRLDNPLESSLKLADGYITLGQLLSPGWRMPNLYDVFISCCKTGLGVTEITDDILTLATGFLCAGARSVVSTLWSVDDIATSIFSIIYHQNRKQGLNRPQSLQQAQIQLRTMNSETLAVTYKPLLEPMLSEKLKYSETNRKEVKRQQSQFSDDSLERKNLEAEYDKWNKLSRQISQTKKRLEWLCQQEYPFENPVYWAAFVCHGLS